MGSDRAEGTGSANNAPSSDYDEKSPLLNQSNGPFEQSKPQKRWLFPKRVFDGLVGGVAVLLSPIVYTGQYLVACFYYEEDGRFSLAAPFTVWHESSGVRDGRKPLQSQCARLISQTARQRGTVETGG